MAITLNATIGHSLTFFALNLASWLLRFDYDHPEGQFLSFIMIVLPCFIIGLFIYFDSLENPAQRRRSAAFGIMGLNAGLFYQWHFLEPNGLGQLFLRTAYSGYYGIVIAGIGIMCGIGADEKEEGRGPSENDVRVERTDGQQK